MMVLHERLTRLLTAQAVVRSMAYLHAAYYVRLLLLTTTNIDGAI